MPQQLKTEQTNELMVCQMRRDFLRKHAQFIQQKTNTPIPVISDPSLQSQQTDEMENYRLHLQFLKDETLVYTRYLEDFLKQSSSFTHYISGALLPTQNDHSRGISTRLSNYFSQLSSGKNHPFVQLTDENGLCFYWENNTAASQFAAVLQAHGIPVTSELKPLEARYLPQGVTTLPLYQSNSTSRVNVPHRYVESLLEFAQYHPYEYEKILDDLYQGKLDRTKALHQEANTVGSLMRTDMSVDVKETARFSLNDKEDVVAITVGARAPKQGVKPVPHLIFVVDDSGSMAGAKMAATNKALRQLIDSLPDDTLVSIQPLNGNTIANRLSASALKKIWADMLCPGNTPLLEAIISSATFFRAHPLDPLISEEEFNRTTVVILTDGEPNGPQGKTVKQLMPVMRDSSGIYITTQNVTPNSRFPSLGISFGTEATPCHQDPVVLGFCIGPDADTQFMKELAASFCTPQGFIRTDHNLDSDMKNAMALIAQMQGRYKRATLGITYTLTDGEIQAQQKVFRNLFYGFGRCAFFKVPKGVPVSATLIHETDIVKGLFCNTVKDNPELLSLFLQEAFETLKNQYETEVSQIAQRKNPVFFNDDEAKNSLDIEKMSTIGRKGGNFPKQEEDYPNEPEKWTVQKSKLERFQTMQEEAQARQALFVKFDSAQSPLAKLQKKTREQLQSLIQSSPNDNTALHQQMLLYLNTTLANKPLPVNPVSGDPSINSQEGRAVLAAYSQIRHVGVPLKTDTFLASSDLNQLFLAFERGDFKAVENKLRENPALIDELDSTKGTLLLATLYQLKEKPAQPESYQVFFSTLLKQYNPSLCQQDLKGNTVAHCAAWWGQKTALLQVIQLAKDTGQLDVLLKIRNNQHVGGTTIGETFLDNVRGTNQLSAEDKKEIIRAATSPAMLNYHQEPAWNTQLMVELTELRATNDPSIRMAILNHLRLPTTAKELLEANFNGNTALHFALWNGEYEIAFAMLKTAEADSPEILQAVLAARNQVGISHYGDFHSGGEVPHMNLVAKLQQVTQCTEAYARAFQIIGYFAEHYPVLLDESGKEVCLITLLEPQNLLQGSIRALELIHWNIHEGNKSGLSDCIQQLQSLHFFRAIYQFISIHANDKTRAELGHLYTVYDKEIQGYSALNFLQQSPLIQLIGEAKQVNQMKLLPKALDGLADSLDEVIRNMNPGYVNAVQAFVEDWLHNNPVDTQSFYKENSTLRDLLRTISNHLSLIGHYQAVQPDAMTLALIAAPEVNSTSIPAPL